MDVDDLDDATLVAGAPRSGKTRFALDMLVAAMKRHGDAYAVMDGLRQTGGRPARRTP